MTTSKNASGPSKRNRTIFWVSENRYPRPPGLVSPALVSSNIQQLALEKHIPAEIGV